MKQRPNDLKDDLKDELRSAGAQPGEISMLAALAGQLAQLHESPQNSVIPTLTRKQGGWRPIRRLGLSAYMAFACLVLGIGLVIFSQASVPGSWLYPVKKLSENTAVLIHPEYRATIMMHRAAEVKVLVAHHSSNQEVFATLNDYSIQAKTYKMPSYATLEYCKSNLEQAAALASPPEQQAIYKTLASLSTS